LDTAGKTATVPSTLANGLAIVHLDEWAMLVGLSCESGRGPLQFNGYANLTNYKRSHFADGVTELGTTWIQEQLVPLLASVGQAVGTKAKPGASTCCWHDGSLVPLGDEPSFASDRCNTQANSSLNSRFLYAH